MARLTLALAKTDQDLAKLAAERAYELLPNSRDIVLLASSYRPELIKEVKDSTLYSLLIIENGPRL